MMETILTRRELYDLVWSTPMTKLAERFGMSGRGLAKVCARHRVPVPSRGHWARVEAGQHRKQPIFVEVDDPAIDPVPIGGAEARSRAASRRQRPSPDAVQTKPKHVRELEELRAKWAEQERIAALEAEERANRTYPQTTYVFDVAKWDWEFDIEQQGEAPEAGSNPHEAEVLPGFEGFELSGVLTEPAHLRMWPIAFRVEPTRPLKGIHFF